MFNRRQFIAITGVGAGATYALAKSVSDQAPKKLLSKIASSESSDNLGTPTYCEMCFWKCAGWIHLDENKKPWKITGNKIDQHSFGRLCTRGTGGIGAYTDPDRLKKPLLRVKNSDDTQSFKEVEWSEALDFIASKLKKLEPESVALFSHGTGGDYFKTLLQAMGSKNITAPSYAQCRGARDEAFKLTFGDEAGSPEKTDIENAKCLVLIGSHLGENLHNSQVQEFATAIERGCDIITVDPRFSTAASKSKFWIPVKPGTDLALLLAWIHVIINEELYNKKYIEKYATGLKELKELTKTNTPEWAYPITSIDPQMIRDTARLMAKHAPATCVHPSRHVAWYGDDTQRLRAVAILNALLGSWGNKGGFYFSNKAKVKGYPIPEFPKPKRTWFDLNDGKLPFASQIPATGIREWSIPREGRPAEIKAWIIYATNLIQCMPNSKETIAALQNLDLVVAIDLLPAEITGYADVVLPECSYLERDDDIRIAEGKEAQIAVRLAAVDPLYDSKPAWWMARELAHKMGYGAFFPWTDFHDYLNTRLKSVGSSLEEMKKVGVKRLKDQEHPLYLAPGEDNEFGTDSGKIELYSKALKDAGHDPVPRYTAHPTAPEGYFRMLYGRAPAHTFGKTVNNPLLSQLMPENCVWVHPDVASEFNLKNGQYVKLKSVQGTESLPIQVKVTERIRTDAVYMVHGFGHTDIRCRQSFNKGADDTGLITEYKVDPIMGATGFRGTFVTFIA